MSDPSSISGAACHRLSLAANTGLVLLKGGAGLLAGSPVLLADAVHSLADVALSVAAWLGFRWSQAPPDGDHHFGHGNGEALAGLVVGLVVCSTGIGLGAAAFLSEAHTAEGALGLVALAVALVVMGVKAWLARRMGRAGRILGSPSVLAVARDHKSDVYAGFVVFVGVAGVPLGAPWLETVATLVVGVLITRMGIESVREGFDILMDRVSDPTLRGRLAETAASVPGVRWVRDVRVHPLGASHAVSLAIAVDGSLTVDAGHDLAHEVEEAVKAAHDQVDDVHVHVEPYLENPGETPAAG